MPWKELVRIALLGSDRTEVPDALKKTMQSLGVKEESDVAKAILQAATKLHVQKKAGYIALILDGEWPLGPESTTERFCSPTATRYLQQMLDGKFEQALPEFFHLAKSEGRFLPPEQVPKLLQQATENPNQLAILKPLLGKHAHWLIAQHPEWSLLFEESDPANWDTSTFQQRVHIFQQLRKNNIARSIELLQTIWKDLDVRQKTTFLSAMESSLCLDDEVLLEPALDDRRKEVRQQTAHLLSQIPESALLKRTWERLDPLVRLKKQKDGKEKAIISLPEEVTEEMLRDGLNPSQQWLRGGLKASRLAQMMAIIPPKNWEIKFNKSAEDLVAIFAKNEYTILLLQALSHATALHQNDDWSISILAFWLDHYQEDNWANFKPKALYQQLSADAFNAIALPALLKCNDLPGEEDPVSLLIRKNDHPWEEALTREFIIKCKEWIAQHSSSYWTAFQLKNMIQKAAYHINPNLADSLTRSWPVSATACGSWEGEIEQFFKILRFRKSMREALSTLEN